MTRPLAPCSRLWKSFIATAFVRDCAWVYDVNRFPSVACCLNNFPYPRSAAQRYASSSSTRWKDRQKKDRFTKDAKLQGLKSRAAFKLLEINEKHKLFKKGITVVDLGYAPGSWSQVAVNRIKPNGRVVGIDIIPAQPPKGVSTIQGNFLSPKVQAEVRAYIQDPEQGRARPQSILVQADEVGEHRSEVSADNLENITTSYIDLERRTSTSNAKEETPINEDVVQKRKKSVLTSSGKTAQAKKADEEGKVVDVVLSDMSEPWEQAIGPWKRSFSDPYLRMMNMSGMPFRDHVGSMDLCLAALNFCYDTLCVGGHFLCKFYAGAEDAALEKKLKRLFEKVHREKPDSSRNASREAYFVGLRRKADVIKEEVFRD